MDIIAVIFYCLDLRLYKKLNTKNYRNSFPKLRHYHRQRYESVYRNGDVTSEFIIIAMTSYFTSTHDVSISQLISGWLGADKEPGGGGGGGGGERTSNSCPSHQDKETRTHQSTTIFIFSSFLGTRDILQKKKKKKEKKERKKRKENDCVGV